LVYLGGGLPRSNQPLLNHQVLMKLILILWLSLSSLLAVAVTHSQKISKELNAKISTLVELLSDGYAVYVNNSSSAETIHYGEGGEYSIVLFNMEGFGGGNNFSQYLAVFSIDSRTNNKKHFSLVDVIQIGGGGWRVISSIVNSSYNSMAGDTAITFDGLENTADDASNFPSKKINIVFVIKKGSRLIEQ
jgi:hypothetical protein